MAISSISNKGAYTVVSIWLQGRVTVESRDATALILQACGASINERPYVSMKDIIPRRLERPVVRV